MRGSYSFSHAEGAHPDNQFSPPLLRSQIFVNRGLLLFAKNEFVLAQESFHKAATLAAEAAEAKEEPPDQHDGECRFFFHNFKYQYGLSPRGF